MPQLINSLISDGTLQGLQFGFIEPRLDLAIERLTAKMDIKRFVVIKDFLAGRVITYRGKTTQIQLSTALGYAGDIQVEILSQQGEQISPYMDFIASGTSGFHHTAYWTTDLALYERIMRSSGFEEYCGFEDVGGGNRDAIYFQDRRGICIEVAQLTPNRLAFNRHLRKVCDAAGEKAEGNLYFENRDEFMTTLPKHR